MMDDDVEKDIEMVKGMEKVLNQRAKKKKASKDDINQQLAAMLAAAKELSDEEEEDIDKHIDTNIELSHLESGAYEDAPDPDEWEELEEVEHVIVDLIGLIDDQTLLSADRSKIKFIGLLESDRPVLQIDSQVFVGRREFMPGTGVLMKVADGTDWSSDEEDPLNSEISKSKTSYRLESPSIMTTKKLVMYQAALSEKDSKDCNDVSDEQCIPSEEPTVSRTGV